MRLSIAFLLALLASGCDCSGTSHTSCRSSRDCPMGQSCIDGTCMGGQDGGGLDATGGDDAGPPDAFVCGAPRFTCGTACCQAGDRCWRDAQCIPDRGTCTDNDDCWSDTWCDEGVCAPWGSPPDDHDPSCTQSIDIDAIAPDVQCRWTGPPSGEPFPAFFQVMATPVVVDFDLDDNPATLRPSIVFTSFSAGEGYGGRGVLRVIDGATCEPQFSANDPADSTMGPASVAVGDLDGDGRAEIVAATQSGGLFAFAWDATARTFVRRWRSATCAAGGGRTPDNTGGGDQWAGPSIHDLDDDGLAEIVYGAVVYDRDGCIVSNAVGYPAYHRGVVPVIADVAEDGRLELVQGNSIYEWSAAGRQWMAESYFAGAGLGLGQVAVADLGNFPLASQGGADRAEVVVIASGAARVQTIEGTLVFGPVALPGGGTGGPPTIADFDGDGRVEFASAGGTRYVVFDLDCVAGGDPARCASGATNGILWTQPSQDGSSNVTGSSVFDFDANGAAEAVYADECYLRIYEGATGTVVYSAARSSGTTYENPVIADVDGDFHTEIVSSVNDYAGTLGCPGTDPLRPGSTFSTAHGIVVLRDVLDRWAASRPVWNQHAYAVTHVGERGSIPRASAVAVNWRTSGLNNFRQNVQGDLEALGTPDLTTTAISNRLRVPCEADGTATLRARVCNRGSLPMAAGFVVAFRDGAQDGPELCRASSDVFLGVGECGETSCMAVLPLDRAIDVYVVADPDATSGECYEGNNFGLQPNVACETIE
ncbi:MAG: hypothetical protein IT378_01715 [Sandaracinaceae bacterium]|nr:hypothetical protein [Sandaracinaceae bacterium]